MPSFIENHAFVTLTLFVLVAFLLLELFLRRRAARRVRDEAAARLRAAQYAYPPLPDHSGSATLVAARTMERRASDRRPGLSPAGSDSFSYPLGMSTGMLMPEAHTSVTSSVLDEDVAPSTPVSDTPMTFGGGGGFSGAGSSADFDADPLAHPTAYQDSMPIYETASPSYEPSASYDSTPAYSSDTSSGSAYDSGSSSSSSDCGSYDSGSSSSYDSGGTTSCD